MPTIKQDARIENDELIVTRIYKFSLAEVLKGVEYSVFKETGPDSAKRLPKNARAKPKRGKGSLDKKAYNKAYHARKKAEAGHKPTTVEFDGSGVSDEKANKVVKLAKKVKKAQEEQDEMYARQRP